jgi:hypothetical protein
MRRQLRSSLISLLAVIAVCVGINAQTARASAVPVATQQTAHQYLTTAHRAPSAEAAVAPQASAPDTGWDWQSRKTAETRGFSTSIRETWVHGGKPFLQLFDRDRNMRLTDAHGRELPKVTISVLYPTIGPYWKTLRWLDAGDGHPFVCVRDQRDGLGSFHPIGTVTHKYWQPDFKTQWYGDITIIDPTGQDNRYTHCMRDGQGNSFSDWYILDVRAGYRLDSCNYNAIYPTDDGRLVKRAISYWSNVAFGGECFDLAEENVWRTTTVIGAAFGLEWHHGSGAPSPFGGTLDYIWPQQYDLRTIAWYNGPSNWLVALVFTAAGWICIRRSRRDLPRLFEARE